MQRYNVAPLDRLVEQFERLPGIGSKTAQRLAYFVLNMPKAQAKEFSEAILDAHEKIRHCEICCNFSDKEIKVKFADGTKYTLAPWGYIFEPQNRK